jgi:hypothetical protein
MKRYSSEAKINVSKAESMIYISTIVSISIIALVGLLIAPIISGVYLRKYRFL